jgi:hypothetical protein
MIPTGVDIVDESGIVPAQESSRPLHDDFILPRPFSSTKILFRFYLLRQRLLWALSAFDEERHPQANGRRDGT